MSQNTEGRPAPGALDSANIRLMGDTYRWDMYFRGRIYWGESISMQGCLYVMAETVRLSERKKLESET